MNKLGVSFYSAMTDHCLTAMRQAIDTAARRPVNRDFWAERAIYWRNRARHYGRCARIDAGLPR